MRVWWLIGAVPLVAMPWFACRGTAHAPPAPLARAPVERADQAIGQPVTRYVPDGCAYTVALPDGVDDATLDGAGAGADPAPRHIHVGWAGAPATTFAINWSTGLDTQLSRIVYGNDRSAVAAADSAGAGINLQHGHTFVYGGGLLSAGERTRIHETHVCGLAPGRTYYYKVGGPGHWSTVYDVATGPAPHAAASFRFVVTGDARDEPGVFAEIERRIAAEAPDFQIFTGDAVGIGTSQPEWDAFFEAQSGGFRVEDALARTPLLAVNGNHENLALNYFAQFAFPGEASPGEQAASGGKEWYSFDYGNAHFAMLDDQASGAALRSERDWLVGDLAKVDRAQTPWVFAVHHKPIYTCSIHSPDLDTRALWAPVYDAAHVDFVLNGHNHCYERSVPIKDAREVASGAGTIYVTAGGAGAPLYGTARCPLVDVAEKTRGFVVIEIDGAKLSYRALRLDGSEIERFSSVK